MELNENATYIRPSLRGSRLVQLIDLIRVLLGHSLTINGAMNRSMAISVILTRFVPALAQKLYAEIGSRLSDTENQKVLAIASNLGLSLTSTEMAAEASNAFSVKDKESGQGTTTSMTNVLSQLSTEDWS